MKIKDEGHKYELFTLDGNLKQTLTFVKRQGEKYPGNESQYPGTTSQDVIRCLINRTQYVNWQKSCWQNRVVLLLLRLCIYLFEDRHNKKHNIKDRLTLRNIERVNTCKNCGHIHCLCNANKS